MIRKTRLLLAYLLILVAAQVVLAAGAPPAGPANAAKRPKLVLLIVMDQFRQDFLVRHHDSFVPGGFRLLLDRGAQFANCNYLYSSTITAPGHTVISTGSYPMTNGIIDNDWFDRASGTITRADLDPSTQLLGVDDKETGSSPHWLIGDAFADELRMASHGQAKVIAISAKARSAVLPGGKSANAAYWFDYGTLHAVTSTYYVKELPGWVKDFNGKDRAAAYSGKAWTPVDNPKGEAFRTFPVASDDTSHRKLASAVSDSPFMTDIEFELAKEAIANEKLGNGTATDMLSISVSATDFIGHEFGPDAPETRDTILRADRSIAALLKYIDERMGLNNVWVALSADHGVAPTAQVAHGLGINAGRVANKTVVQKVESALTAAYGAPGEGNWVQAYTFPHLYLNHALLAKRKVSEEDAARRAAQAVLELDGFAAAFTRTELARCKPSPELLGEVCRAWYAPRSGDVYVVFKPYWIYEGAPRGTGHGTPYSYDTHVPLVFFGSAFRAGTYYQAVSPADLPVTLSAALGINAPALATGHVLGEALVAPARAAQRATGR